MAIEVARKRLRRHHPVARQGQAPRVVVTLEKALESGEFVTGTVNGKVKGGLTVLINGIRAFLPGSLRRHASGQGHDAVRGQDPRIQGHQARPQAQQRRAVAPRRGRSQHGRRARQADGNAEGRRGRQRRRSRTSPTTARSSTSAASTACCTSPTWHGAACVIRAKCCQVGQEITAKVLKFDQEKNRVSLGVKQLGDDPWIGLSRRYPQGTRLFGKVTNITDYGAFVEIEPGIEGLVHVSEMDWTNKNVAPNKVVQLGDEVEVMVLEIDEERRRISLGMKQCKPNPWDDFASYAQEGRQGQGPDQVDHRLRRVHRPAAAASTASCTCPTCRGPRPAKKPCASTRRATKSKRSCWRSTSSASASRWASSSSKAIRSPTSPPCTTRARSSQARSSRSMPRAP